MSSAQDEVVHDEVTPPVIISFAASDADTVEEAAASLESRGHAVTLVPGVEGDADVLTEAIRQHEGQGLYVLCRSPALGRNTIDELRSLLRSNGVPFGRTLTLALESKRARALEERIVSVLRRMITGRGAMPRPVVPVATPPPQTDEETDTRIRPPGDSGSGRIPVDLGVLPPPYEHEIAAWADSLVGGRAFREGIGPTGPWPALGGAPLPTAAEPSDPNASTSRIDPDAESPADLGGPTSAPAKRGVGSPRDPAAAGNTAVGPEPKPPVDIPMIPAMPSAPVPPPPEMSASRPAMPDPLLSSLSGSAPAPSHDVLDDDGSAVGGGLRGALGPKGTMLAIGGGVVLLLIVIVAFAFSGDDAKDEIAKADVDKSAQKAADAPARDKETKAEAPPSEPAAVDDAGADAGADDSDEPGPAADEEPPPQPPKPATNAEPDPPAVQPAAEPPVTPKPTKVTAADAAKIARALRDREVRALDIFIVSPETKGGLSHGAAVAYCGGLVVAEIGGWRLPQIGELNSLGAAKLVRKDVFWSDTEGDTFGDTRLVLNAKKDRIGAVPKSWDGAKAVCVRKRG